MPCKIVVMYVYVQYSEHCGNGNQDMAKPTLYSRSSGRLTHLQYVTCNAHTQAQ